MKGWLQQLAYFDLRSLNIYVNIKFIYEFDSELIPNSASLHLAYKKTIACQRR